MDVRTATSTWFVASWTPARDVNAWWGDGVGDR